MALRLSQEGDWHFIPHTTAIRAYVLVASQLCNSISSPGEHEELSVTGRDGGYRLRIVSVLDAPADYVYDVITDYKHAYRINPSITEVEILSTERAELIRVRNL
jgi:hypothetical protein